MKERGQFKTVYHFIYLIYTTIPIYDITSLKICWIILYIGSKDLIYGPLYS